MLREPGGTLGELARWTSRLWTAAACAAPPLLILAAASDSTLLRSTGELLLVCYTLPLVLVSLGSQVRLLLRRIAAPAAAGNGRGTRA